MLTRPLQSKERTLKVDTVWAHILRWVPPALLTPHHFSTLHKLPSEGNSTHNFTSTDTGPLRGVIYRRPPQIPHCTQLKSLSAQLWETDTTEPTVSTKTMCSRRNEGMACIAGYIELQGGELPWHCLPLKFIFGHSGRLGEGCKKPPKVVTRSRTAPE